MAKSGKAAGKPPNGLKRLEDRLKPAQPRNFPAYVRANFERLSRILETSERGAAKWTELAKWAEDEKILGENTKLTPVAAKRAYEREAKRRKSMEHVAAAKKPARPVSKPARVSQQQPPLAKEPPEAQPDSDPIAALRREINRRSGRND